MSQTLRDSQPETGAKVTETHMRELFSDLDGFIATRVLLTALDMDLFTLLGDGPLPVQTIERALALPNHESASSFLRICMRMGYLRISDAGYGLAPLGLAVLKNRQRFAEYARERRQIYTDLANLTELIRDGNNQSSTLDMFIYKRDGIDRAACDGEAVASYTQNQGTTNVFWAHLILESIDLSSYSSLLDVGCGAGNLAIRVANRYPGLRVGCFDLVPVIATSKENATAQGVADRIEYYPGDFLQDPLPRSFDVICIMRVCWDWSDGDVGRLLANVYEALPDGGRVMVCESMYPDSLQPHRERALHDVRLLLIGGKVRSALEYCTLLSQQGFKDMKTHTTDVTSFKIVEAVKS